MINRRMALVGATALGVAGSWPLARADAPLDAAALRQDIVLLRRAYTLLHPGLYRYATPAEMAARFDALERDFTRAPTLADAYLTLSRFLATIRCGHTYANFYNQSDKVADALFTGRDKLPFHFRWLGDRMIVTRNQSTDARIVAGTEVLEIDGRPVAQVLRDLMPFARADGSNDAKRRALLEVAGVDRFETFDIFYSLLFKPQSGSFNLRLRFPGSSATPAIDVRALDLTERRAGAPPEVKGDAAPLWKLDFSPQNVAVLTTPDWALYNTKWDWHAFLDESFAAIAKRNPRGLVVDLRGNEGGLDCGNEIVARLIDKDLPLESNERRVRFRTTPADLDPYLDTWDKSFKKLGEDATDIGGGFFKLNPQADGKDGSRIYPKGPRLTGALIVLIDAQNSSATFQFAQTVQSNRLGRLCGQPTGGNQRGINGGAFFFFRLPGSGLEADLPLIGSFPTQAKPDAGLSPDIFVTPTIEDITTGRDRTLETAIGLLARA